MYVTVKGPRSEMGVRPSVGSLSRTSLAALSAASFPRIPTCPGTHTGSVPFWSTYILCNIYLVFVLAEDGQFLIFPLLGKQIVNLRESVVFVLLVALVFVLLVMVVVVVSVPGVTSVRAVGYGGGCS